jgi:hypothetical protein
MEDDDLDYVTDFSTAAMKWLAERNRTWLAGNGKHAKFHINFVEGKIYFYDDAKDFPDRPSIWYPGETIGSWSPIENGFMWEHENEDSYNQSSTISEVAARWIDEHVGTRKNVVIKNATIDFAWRLVAIAARLADVEAVYDAQSKFKDVKNELESIGERVSILKGRKIYCHNFFAITGEKHVVASTTTA